MFQKLRFHLFLQARCFYSRNHIPSNKLSYISEQFDKKFNKIMIMVGAGLSTPSGIPDFRSPGTGLYSNLQKYNLSYPEQMFDLEFFKYHPEPFFDLAKELYPGKYQPNLSHYFILLLQEKGKLLRLYTQNIDGLERLAGIKEELLVEAHGTFATASCINCRASHDPVKVREDVFKSIVSKCDNCQGIVKPDIVFFGEELPKRYHHYSSVDPDHTDLLIVIGTSLEVYPFAWLGETVPLEVPRLLINRVAAGMLGTRKYDVIFLTDIIEGIESLTKEIGWYEELKNLVQKKNSKQNEVKSL